MRFADAFLEPELERMKFLTFAEFEEREILTWEI